QAAVARAGDTQILPVGDEPYPRVRERGYDLTSPVGRAVVNDEKLEVLPGLRQDARDGFADQRFPVESRDEDGDPRGCRHALTVAGAANASRRTGICAMISSTMPANSKTRMNTLRSLPGGQASARTPCQECGLRASNRLRWPMGSAGIAVAKSSHFGAER